MKKLSISNKMKIVSVTLAIITVLTVSPTLAYLSAATDPVVNYFSGGAIAITLDEAPVDTDGQKIDGDRVQENHYKYVAGAKLDKDPTVTVLANSEDCYVYVCVDNELPASLFSIDINTDAWTYVSTSGTMTIYRYATSVASSTSNQTLTPVFTTVTVSESLTSDDITELGTKTLTVTAFAIQTASLTTDEADDLAEDYFYNGVDVASLEAEAAAGNTANTQAVQTTGTAVETVSSEATTEAETTASTEEPTETETTVSTEETAGTEAAEGTLSTEKTAETETTEETVPAEETAETETIEETASREETAETEATEETASEEETAAGETETGESGESASEEATEQESGADDASEEAAAASAEG